MTKACGVVILGAPCCGARYAFPNYVSMNFSARAYWTDGWRDDSLMHNDEGLRQCRCGRFILLKQLTHVGTEASSDLPLMTFLLDAQLPECIALADDDEVEIAARLMYWRALNHPYRERYREHRDAEEAAIKAEWVANDRDTRTWWQKLRKVPRPTYRRPANAPFTVPLFEPDEVQLRNMARLSELLQPQGSDVPKWRWLQCAELYREQGRFEEAQAMIERGPEPQSDVESRVIAGLISERQAAPTRYRI